ncbi:MAG: hypothetical protein C5B50_09780 [Verrucomicrobia bacterium]|nr:MAG: hypothetical protein C5B50_09780 [Verrucomicrobiota bacterium]
MTNEVLLSFELLELEPDASRQEAKQAYRQMAKVWHPDRFSNDPKLQIKAQEKLKQINSAYEILQKWYEDPQAFESNDFNEERVHEENQESPDSQGSDNDVASHDPEDSESRLPESVIQAKLDRRSIWNWKLMGLAIILLSVGLLVVDLVVAVNIDKVITK